MANLEDISGSGVCVQLESPIPQGTSLCLSGGRAEFNGTVRYCVFRETGYFIGVEFDPGSRWSERRFRPKHMLDPRTLLSITKARPTGDCKRK